MTAGYSGTPLVRKLGINTGAVVAALDTPAGFSDLLGALPEGAALVDSLPEHADLVVAFLTRRQDLQDRFADLAEAIRPDGALWLAWPKKSSGKATDLTRDVIREEVLKTDLVDVKICAISEVWSGLKVVWRTSAR
ncbi:MAG TPA: DUF3052 family protein [Acidimicrobiales bacterium]